MSSSILQYIVDKAMSAGDGKEEERRQREEREKRITEGQQPQAPADLSEQGMAQGKMQEQGGGANVFDLFGLEDYDPARYVQGKKQEALKAVAGEDAQYPDQWAAEKVRDAKGAVFDAAAQGLKGDSGQDTLVGGTGGDSLPGGDGNQSKQRQVDETSWLEDFLSSRLTGESAGKRKERNLAAHERDAANFLAENPKGTYEDYKKAGGKAGAGAFKELQQSGALRSAEATKAKYGEEEITRAHRYNSAVRNYFASDGKSTKGLVGYANEYLGDMLGGGKMENLEDNGDGSFTATIVGKDGKKVQQPISQGQFRTLLAGDQAVNQKLATALRQGQMETYKKLKAQGIEDDLAWKTAFGENKPKEEKKRILGRDAKGLPVYEGDDLPEKLYAGGLPRAAAKDPTPQRVTMADGTQKWVKPGEAQGLPIEGTGTAQKAPNVSDLVSATRFMANKWGAGSDEVPEIAADGSNVGTVLAKLLSPKASWYQNMQNAAARGDTEAVSDLEDYKRLQALSKELTLGKSNQQRSVTRSLSRSLSGGRTAKASSAPKVGEVRKGYRFKGGDPAKEESWEKVE